MTCAPESDQADGGVPLGGEMPDGVRFVGPTPDLGPRWRFPLDAPADADLAACVACGLCLPHCPTYRVTGEESASPRGRITAMRSVAEGRSEPDETFARFMDLCLACRACEDVCPSHVPFGRMVERARVQVEPLRSRRSRFLRWLGLDVALPRKKLLWLAAAVQPLARLALPERIRALTPKRSALFRRLPRETPPVGEERGTVALLSGCVQDRWFRGVNLATIRVLARNGWRVVVPRAQVCCGALAAHNGRLDTARELAERNLRAFAGVDVVVTNAAGCGAHLQQLGDLIPTDAARAFSTKVRDVMELLHDEGLSDPPAGRPGFERVAYHDACHALRVQHLREQPRALLRTIEGVQVARRAERGHVLRRRRPLQRARARDVVRAPAAQGRGRRVDRRRGRGEREHRLHDADRGRPPRARVTDPGAAPGRDPRPRVRGRAVGGGPGRPRRATSRPERLTRLRVVARDRTARFLVARYTTWMFTPASAIARAIAPMAPGPVDLIRGELGDQRFGLALDLDAGAFERAPRRGRVRHEQVDDAASLARDGAHAPRC